jgi:hypothetical protein
MMATKRRLGMAGSMLAMAVSGAVLLAACGSSSHTGAGATATTAGGTVGTTGTTTAPGKSYSVMVIGTFTSPASYNVPEIVTATKAAFAGTGVKVLSCDDQGSASVALNCEHSAIVDHVAAVAAGYAYVAQDESPLTQAGIPVIGNTDSTSSNSFAIASNAGVYSAIGVGLAKAGCTRLGILYLDGTDFLANAIVGNTAWQSVTKAAIPVNAPDLTASITKLAEGKVGCIAISTEPNTVPQAMTAIKQDGLNVKVAAVEAILNTQVLSALGSAANGIIAIENQLDPSDPAPVIGEIKSEMKAVSSSAPVTTAAITAWASAKLLEDAAQNITGPVTAASMLAALNGLRNASTDGAIPPFSAIPVANPAYARFFNHYGVYYTIQGGVPQGSSGFFDLTSALNNKSQ